jgi:flagellar protein FlaI
MEKVEVDRYIVISDGIPVPVSIQKDTSKFVLSYNIQLPKLEEASLTLLEDMRDKILASVPIKLETLRDPVLLERTRTQIKEMAKKLLQRQIPGVSEDVLRYSSTFLADEMLGLGTIEILLRDENLEEVVINNSKEPIWVYHKKYGWLISNVVISSESQIENYASIVGRKVGRQINILDPLMDAHMMSGDRVNATLFPISTKGNTLTIRKFRRKPWTITDLILNNTLNFEISSFLWLAMQYELSMIIAGGTASGKTTLLNVLMPFIPPNERIISIEDTRELNLPNFLHWVPLTTREPNPEGKGEVNMLQLLTNSLRMRPDRVIVGEIRRQPEAEVLFEALNTGHSVYSTLHANTVEEAFRRLTSPPINLPPQLIQSLPMFSVMFRHRKLNIRRVLEISELIDVDPDKKEAKLNKLYGWSARTDKVERFSESVRLVNELNMFTGMSRQELRQDISEKESVLRWLVKNKVNTVNAVGSVISKYYADKENTLRLVIANSGQEHLIGDYMKELRG